MVETLDFQQVGVGPTLEIYNIPNRISFALRSGYKHDSTFGNGLLRRVGVLRRLLVSLCLSGKNSAKHIDLILIYLLYRD